MYTKELEGALAGLCALECTHKRHARVARGWIRRFKGWFRSWKSAKAAAYPVEMNKTLLDALDGASAGQEARAEARRGADTTRTTQTTADMTDEQTYWEAMAQEEQLMADDEQMEAAAYWNASNHDTRTGERNSGSDRRPQASDTAGAATGVYHKARACAARAGDGGESDATSDASDAADDGGDAAQHTTSARARTRRRLNMDNDGEGDGNGDEGRQRTGGGGAPRQSTTEPKDDKPAKMRWRLTRWMNMQADASKYAGGHQRSTRRGVATAHAIRCTHASYRAGTRGHARRA